MDNVYKNMTRPLFGPNVTRLILRRIGATCPQSLEQYCVKLHEAACWVLEHLERLKASPDNPYKNRYDEDELAAGYVLHILEEMEESACGALPISKVSYPECEAFKLRVRPK